MSATMWFRGHHKILIGEFENRKERNFDFKFYDVKSGKKSYALPPTFQMEFDSTVPGNLAFSPDGTRVAGTNMRNEIGIVDLLDDRRSVVIKGGKGLMPSWSPDGKRIAFSGCIERYCNMTEVFLANVDGSGVRQVTHLPYMELDEDDRKWAKPVPWTDKRSLTRRGELKYREHASLPRWSPDGKRLAFGSPIGIYVMKVDGTELRKIKEGACAHPVWSPDGTKIMYLCKSGGRGFSLPILPFIFNYKSPISNIYVSNADGTSEIQLTRNTYPVNDINASLNVVIEDFDWAP